ncbi:MAG: class SAM-dependent methyltransferase [Labilithrix sp.]|nr:class SAM-dependent methyltransferase [Labilithrix sp.]
MKNESEIASWNGPIGERWVDFQESMDRRIRPFGAAALAKARLAPGQRVLDVGCGCGDLALDAAKAVGDAGHVVGLDVSRPMLARAAERARGLANLELVEHDAATYAVREPFDAIVSRFGVMFFDDPAGAFANLAAALRPGGILAFACWRPMADNPWFAVPLSAMLRVLPAPPPAPADAPGPFAFADPARVTAILGTAGFRDVAHEALTLPVPLGTDLDDALEFVTRIGPSARMLRELDDDTRSRVRDVLRQTLASAGPSFALDGSVWVFTATR